MVKMQKNTAVHRVFPGRVMLLMAGMLLLGACASQRLVPSTPPPLLNLGPEVQIEDVDVLAVSSAMNEFLDRYILKYSDRQTRMYLLLNAIASNGVLSFRYDESLTLTAAEAFEARSGNCIGFANMMIALARKVGLRAHFQEVIRQPEWSSHDDTVLLIKHINVIVESPKYTYVVDVSGIKINPNMRRRIIDDSFAKSLYLNNIGAEALLGNDLRRAYAYMAKAIDTEPHMADSWVNMGVVFGRNNQLDDAETVFQRALEIDTSEFSAMSNLYEVYLAQEDLESAESLRVKVENYRWRNPYYLLKLSNEALEQDRFEESISLLQRAIRKKEDDHLLHFALAKTLYLSGEIDAAEGSLVRARELAPKDMLVYYDRPLIELVAEE
jgi:tetratricopeptide (TPR) repeat protein